MSIAALNWAWSQNCPNATSKLVLIALADKANNDGECWPGLDTVAEMVGVTTRQITTHLSTLEDAGLVVRKRQRGLGGRLGRSVYHLSVHRKPTSEGDDQKKSTSRSEVPEDGHLRKSTSRSALPSPEEVQRNHHRKPTSSLKATHSKQPTENLGDVPSRADIFEALVAASGWRMDGLTKSERGRTNKAAKDLHEIGASPAGIRARGQVHREKWPELDVTPNSIATNYQLLGSTSRGGPPPKACPDCQVALDNHDEEACAMVKAGKL